jgi:hypothetical protein
MQLRHTPETDDDNESDEDEVFIPPAQPWRLTRQARDTILFCLVTGAIAALVWGAYRWTDASRFAPPIYQGTTTLKQ